MTFEAFAGICASLVMYIDRQRIQSRKRHQGATPAEALSAGSPAGFRRFVCGRLR